MGSKQSIASSSQPAWNQIPQLLAAVRLEPAGLASMIRYGTTRAGAGYICWRMIDLVAHRTALRYDINMTYADSFSGCVWYALCAVLSVLLTGLGWHMASAWLQPPAANVSLDKQQATLWGLPASFGRKPDAVGVQQQQQQQQQQPQQSGQTQSLLAAISPLRNQEIAHTAADDLQSSQVFATPLDRARTAQQPMTYSQSPYGTGGSPVVTTPEQLKQFMERLDSDMTPQATPALGLGISSYAAATSSPSNGTPGHGGAQRGSIGVRSPQEASGLGSGLKMGVQAPVYRPTVLPTRAGGQSGGSHGKRALTPSAPRQAAAALHQLSTDQHTLEVWTERFREWLAAHLLRPLVDIMDNCHQQVQDAVTAAGHPGLQLSPLGRTLPLDAAIRPCMAGSPVTMAAAAAAAAADEEAVVQQLEVALQSRIAQQPANAQAIAALQAVQMFCGAAALLAGNEPAGLLPPAPAAYLATRVRQLAEGTCMKAFTWNSGGEWQGRPWAPDLPTDVAVLFYLFAAYLETPRWNFGCRKQHTAAGAPLFVATLPARQPEHFYALLPFRPIALAKGSTAVLALQLGSREPHFSLVLGGEPLLTASSPSAMFTTLLLLLHSANIDSGAIGGRSLEYLQLDSVLKPAGKLRDVFTSRWFGMWT